MLTRDDVLKVLRYDPETGYFYWLPRPVDPNASANHQQIAHQWNGRNGDKRAGSKQPNGYIYIPLSGKLRLAHRLAWLVMTGEEPETYLDHINRIRDDNRFVNLRQATKTQNNWNKARRSRSKSGYIGVQISRYGKYRAHCFSTKHATGYLGTYADAESAARAYDAVAKALYGEYAVLNFPDE